MQGYKDLVIQAKNDSKYMQSLLCIMEPLVKSYAKKIFFLDWDDATQELNLAIIEAVKTIATCEDDYQCLKFITNSVKYKFAHLCKRNLKKEKYECAYMDNEDITTDELMQLCPGPDFPTGGIVINKSELGAIYETGTGKIKLRGKVVFEPAKNRSEKDKLVITEIPYTMIGANIGKFISDVVSLIETKKTTDIVDISNESSKEGIRIVLELKKNADVKNLENLLYKKTKLEDTFGVNMLAIVDGRPETLGIKDIIKHHIKFQYELATRKYTTLLEKEKVNREIKEGLIRACDIIDLIIEILRGSANLKMAKDCLVNGNVEGIKFKSEQSKKQASGLDFTERQAGAILEMRLYKLIGLEIEALIKEHEETRAKIAEYSDILEHRSSMAKVIMKELKAFRKEYARDRRTELDNLEEAVVVKKELEVSDVVLLMDRFGYVKTVDTSTYDRNKDTADAENKLILKVKNIDKLCIFTNNGNMHLVKVLDLPYGKFRDKGTPIDNVSNYDSSKEDIVFIAPLMDVEKHKLIFGTKSAMIKLVDGAEFVVTRKTSQATKLMDDDELLFVDMLSENATMVMRSKKEMFLRIDCGTIPEKKKAAVGVRGMRLDREDELTDIYLLYDQEEKEVEVKGKQVELHRLHIANRDTKGVKK